MRASAYKQRYECECASECHDDYLVSGCPYWQRRQERLRKERQKRAERRREREAERKFRLQIETYIEEKRQKRKDELASEVDEAIRKICKHNNTKDASDTNFSDDAEKTYHNLKYSTYILIEKEKKERIELVPPSQPGYNFHLPEIKTALATQPNNEQYLLDAYLTYLGHTTHLRENTDE